MSDTLADATKNARALKAAGRLDEAIQAHRAIVAAYPTHAVVRHNLASALGDAGENESAEGEIRAAMALGADAPESWIVLARCLQALGRLDEAERGYSEALRRRPSYSDAHRELAQLRWMRGADIRAAVASLDDALNARPGDAALLVTKAQALGEANEHALALEAAREAAARAPNDGGVLTILAQLALAAGQDDAALISAEQAFAAAPNLAAAQAVLIEALLVSGALARADAIAGAFCAKSPLNQHAIALQATIWRLMGDPRYRQLYDYDALVTVAEIEPPPGWTDLGAYLSDLGAALHAAHHFQMHPFGQSIKHGSQVANVPRLAAPAARALPQALHGAIDRYRATLGVGADPVRARNAGGFRFQGMWSIRMRAGGRHINHVHPEGWISSACYVETPDAPGREGWLKLGEPGVRTREPLDAERFIEPRPGRLVLFPSYMWHGTVPFTGDGMRMTFAFDIVPA